MSPSNYTAFAICLAVMLSSCSQQSDAVELEKAPKPAKRNQCETGKSISGRIYIRTSDVQMREGPSDNAARVINRKATKALGKTHYRDLSPDYVISGMCQTDEWILGSIIMVEGRPVQWETGWIPRLSTSEKLEGDPALGLYWDISSEDDFSNDEKRIVREGALKVLRDESNCASISTGYRSGSKQGAYYVTCDPRGGGAPFNVWFTPEQIAKGNILKTPEPVSEISSRELCEQSIRGQVTNPSTLNFHSILGYATTVHNNGNRSFVQEFSAKNAFGQKLEFTGNCLILPDGGVELNIFEKDR